MEKWIAYKDFDPPNILIGKILMVSIKSIVDGHIYEQEAMWSGDNFLEKDEEDSWVGPIRTVTHWRRI